MNPVARRQRRQPQEQPVCSQCEHYEVTWDPVYPHGCRAFGFKSAKRPSFSVFESFGRPCELYRPRPRRR